MPSMPLCNLNTGIDVFRLSGERFIEILNTRVLLHVKQFIYSYNWFKGESKSPVIYDNIIYGEPVINYGQVDIYVDHYSIPDNRYFTICAWLK